MRIISVSAFVLLGAAAALAQQPAPTPPPNPAPTPPPQQLPQPVRTSRLPSALNILGLPPSGGFGAPIEADPMARRQVIVQKYAQHMYRKPSDKELRLLTPDAAIVARYSGLLDREDAGIFKLVPDSGCAESARVINASETCMKYSFPGAGNSFSFRTENYRIRHLADITYSKGMFYMTGVLMHGVMVDLGDVPIEQVTLQLPQIAFITAFQPTSDFVKALEADQLLTGGVRKEGFLYRRNLPVVPEHTFVLRSVAYQGRVMRSVHGADFNELDFDKRRDVVTAFRVVNMEDDGTLTIVWSKLSTAPSPKLKVPRSDDVDRLASGRSERGDDRTGRVVNQPRD